MGGEAPRGADRLWGGREELHSAIERHGCEGAVRLCHQTGPENDCYRTLEEACEEYRSRERLGREAELGQEGSADWEPGPHL